ncbi:MAG: SGNH/GDSL hydrolase family protein [Oligoflexia bacterium]|nr:SGNH/GDSL hydrolase family protein [Oligoflexia bacterium]
MRVRRLLFAVLPLLVLAAGAEGLTRAFGPGLLPPDRSPVAQPGQVSTREPNMVGDADTGWRLKVGRQNSFGIPHGTFVNSYGLRAPEVPVQKSRPRVMVVGDSSVFGVLVDDKDTFTARLGAAFPQIEVLNAGVPGYSSWQALQALDHRLQPYQPDLIVVATLWSDTQGADASDATRFGGRHASIIDHSLAFVLLRDWIRELRWGSRPEQVGFGLSPPVAPTTRVPLGDYGVNLRALAKRAPAVAYLVLPCIHDPDQGRVGDFRDAYRETMRDVAADLGAPLADAPPTFVGTDKTRMFLDEVHPSVQGHELIAKLLIDTLRPWVDAQRQR